MISPRSTVIATVPSLGDIAPETIGFAPPTARRRPQILTEGRAIFIACGVVYLALAALLVFDYHSLLADSLSRVANAYYIEFSRDPKIAAVGFVWTPLPSLVLLPFLPLKLIWPALTTVGFISNIESALCMAGAACTVAGILRDMGLRRSYRLVLTVLFAGNPMSLFYGSNGMSEAMLLLTLLLAARSFLRWARNPSSFRLAATGSLLALAYLARYEAIAAGLAVIATVGIATWVRTGGTRERRRHVAIADAIIVGFPFAAAVGLWAGASWLIVGHPFDTFSSRYGNSAQVATASGQLRSITHGQVLDALSYNLHQMLALAPALPAIALLAAVAAVRRRNFAILPPLVVLGAVLVFMDATFADGGSFGFLRFQITSLPLVTLLAGGLLVTAFPATVAGGSGSAVAPQGRWAGSRLAIRSSFRLVGPFLVVAAVAIGLVTTMAAFHDPVLARQEYQYALPAVQRMFGQAHRIEGSLDVYANEHAIARYLDGLDLPNGSVLADDALAFPVVLASDRPKQFILDSDRDFFDAVAHPAAMGVRYILVSEGGGTLDVISSVYPTLYQSGGGIGRIVRSYPVLGASRAWRVIAVNDPVRQ